MKKSLLNALWFTTLAALCACEVESAADVEQDTIYADYELFYDSNTTKTLAIARFRFGNATGTVLNIDGAGEVTFNDEQLLYDGFWQGHIREFDGQITSGVFRYTNANGMSFVNQTPAFGTATFPDSFQTLSKSSTTQFAWEGTPLGQNQGVSIFIGTASTVFGDGLVVVTNPGATGVTLTPESLTNVSSGNATAVMDRATDVEVTEGTSRGGRIRTKFRAPNQSIIITE